MLREYDDVEPIILSGRFSNMAGVLSPADKTALVGEDEEVSIKDVADAIVKAVGFKGDYTVCQPHISP